jgi:hypothetical protein
MSLTSTRLLSLVLATLFSVHGTSQESALSGPFLLTPTTPEAELRDQPVSEEDLAILLRADELLRDSSVWNRQDDRVCDDDESTGKRSLFCALQKASIEVLGTYDHRRVALQEVRFAIVDATNGRRFEHRLRDYNNLPETELSDIKSILSTAVVHVRSRLGRED